MDYLEGLILIAKDNKEILFIIGILLSFLESFFPVIPLFAIVVLNSALLGFTKGIIASIIGSCTGTFIIYTLAMKFRETLFKNYNNEKMDKITSWIKKQGYIVIFFCYSIIFIPSFLISICAGFSRISKSVFIPSMICGKTMLFLIGSYIGYDLEEFFRSPKKIIVVVVVFLLSFIVAKVINRKIN